MARLPSLSTVKKKWGGTRVDERTHAAAEAAIATVVVVSNDRATVEPIAAALAEAGVVVAVHGSCDYQTLLEMLPAGGSGQGNGSAKRGDDAVDAIPTPLAEAKTCFERTYLERLLALTHGNLAQAARLASVDRSNLRRLLKRHGIEADVWRRI
jgi:DNA-binding NtrC family response regulator